MADRYYYQHDYAPGLKKFEDAMPPIPLSFSNKLVLGLLRKEREQPAPVEDVRVEDRTMPGPAGPIPLRLYWPAMPAAARPAYLMFHGGGWSFGHLGTEHARCIELTRRCGAVGISVGYRLAPDHPAPAGLDDCYAALRWAAAHAGELGIDARQIGITGSSAGGALTLSVAQMAADRGEVAPMVQIAFYCNTDDRDLPAYESRRATPAYPVISPANIAQVVSNLMGQRRTPPAYVFPNRSGDVSRVCPAVFFLAQNDPLRDEGIDYAWRLLRAGVPTELHVLPGITHAFDDIAPDSAATRTAYELMCRAFERASADRARAA